MVVIGIAGRKGAGKNTFADGLQGYHQVAFADALKKELMEAFPNLQEFYLQDQSLKGEPCEDLRLSECTNPEFVELVRDYVGCCDNIGITEDGDDLILTPRKAMQLWGTDFRRKDDNLYWIAKLEATIAALQASGYSRIAITDVREHHEVDYVKLLGGTMVRIKGKSKPDDHSNHPSETTVDELNVDIEVINDADINTLRLIARNISLGAYRVR